MQIDLSKRPLDDDKKDFLARLIPWGRYAQYQSRFKAEYFRQIKTAGLFASIFIADSILESNWESHPASLAKYKTKSANNLGLLPTDPEWSGITLKINGISYKGFESWEEYAIHFSDLVAFSGTRPNVPLLQTMNLETQCIEFCKFKHASGLYNEMILTTIQELDLTEFDLWRLPKNS